MLYNQERLDLSELDQPFTKEEVKKTVFDLAKDKTPGSHGFTANFYQHYWDLIREYLLKLFMGIHNGSIVMY